MKRFLQENRLLKALALILLLVTCFFGLIGSILSIVFTMDKDGRAELYKAIAHEQAYVDAMNISDLYLEGKTTELELFLEQRPNATVCITKEVAGTNQIVYGDPEAEETPYTFSFIFGYDQPTDIIYAVDLTIDPTFQGDDVYRAIYRQIPFIADPNFRLIPLTLLVDAMVIVLFVYLLWSVGHKRGVEGLYAGVLTRKIPWDVMTLLTGGLLFSLCFPVAYLVGYRHLINYLIPLAILSLMFVIFTLYAMDLTLRIKLGGFWKNTLLYRFFRLLGRYGKRSFAFLWGLLRQLPLIWKTGVGFAFFAVLSLVAIMPYDGAVRITFWLSGMIILLVLVLSIALMLRKLKIATGELAKGNLSYRVDTTNMVLDFKEMGEQLGQISQGMALAVNERLKSERFKTELITNVSHDIKTPLTSIINYADLIQKEEDKSERVAAYSAVLLRQSDRLKKLLEGLLEASKAATGTLDVHLTPCELGVLLSQVAGEYQHRFDERALTLVLKQPEDKLMVMADGQLLWRVFDNLMSNAHKYAQEGTRVYLSLEQQENAAVVQLKNTSAAPLDLPAEAFLERFSRGDDARNTEGNGLGLSIAQSLTTLQGGTLSLTVDGDLFKLTLTFSPVL